MKPDYAKIHRLEIELGIIPAPVDRTRWVWTGDEWVSVHALGQVYEPPPPDPRIERKIKW